MADCQRIDPLVTPFIDGQLPGDDRRTVEEHLRVCAPCHSRVVAEQAVHDLIRTRRRALSVCAPRPLQEKCVEMARLTLVDAVPNPAAPPRTLPPDRPVAAVSWTARVAPYALAASLFMLPKTARAQQLVEVLGHEAAIWCVGNRTFVVVAREPRQEVERIASFVQASLH